MPLSPIREIDRLELVPIAPGEHFAHNPNAPLDPGIDLNFPGVETQHATHGIHPYVAAINPPLARALIEHYVPAGTTILDPFCGGGGVLVEAVLTGRAAVGSDINPLAVLMSRAKTTYVPLKENWGLLEDLLRSAAAGPSFDRESVPELIRFWYKEDSLGPLVRLGKRIAAIEDNATRTLMQLALSATARDVMLTYRGEIRLRKLQDKDMERFAPNVLQSFRRRAEMALGRASLLPRNTNCRVTLADARALDASSSCHTLITSPPYADDKNGVGYFQFSRNMLFWLGYKLDELKVNRTAFLGCGEEEQSEFEVSPILLKLLKIIKERKQTHYVEAIKFYRGYFEALRRTSSLVAERVIVIIGDRVLARTKINNGHITEEFMVAVGFNLEHYYTRELKKKRISNLGGDGGGTTLEHILVFRRA